MRSHEQKLEDAILHNDISSIATLLLDGCGMDPGVLFSAIRPGKAAIVDLLLKAGADQWIDCFDDFAFTPLMWAVRGNLLDVAQLLIQSGADVNRHDELRIGNTALHEAVDCGNLDMIKMLLTAGADPKLVGWMQLTPADKVEERFEQSPSEENHKILNLLLLRSNLGSDLDGPNKVIPERRSPGSSSGLPTTRRGT